LKGRNCRLDELQAIFLRIKLRHLDAENNKRRVIARHYMENLNSKHIVLPTCYDMQQHVFYLFVIISDRRDELKAYLHANGVETLIHYPGFDYLFMILAITLPFTALYNLCFAIINGKSNYKKATIVTFTAYTLVTVLIILLVVFYGLSGVLLAITLTPVAHLLTLLVFARSEARLFKGIKIRFHRAFKSELFIFILMAFVAVVFNNVIELQLRNHLIKKLSLEEAGYWTSMLSFSKYYLSFMTGVYSLYVLPKYAKIKRLDAFVNEVKHIYIIVLPIFALMFIVIFLLKAPLIQLLYTKEFLPMQILFKWQLLGDMVKIIAVIIAYQFIAQRLWKIFIVTEIISFILLYVFAVYFVEIMGVEGITFAHFLRYIVYLGIVIFAIRGFYKNKTAND